MEIALFFSLALRHNFDKCWKNDRLHFRWGPPSIWSQKCIHSAIINTVVSPTASGFPSQRASNTDGIFMSWHLHVCQGQGAIGGRVIGVIRSVSRAKIYSFVWSIPPRRKRRTLVLIFLLWPRTTGTEFISVDLMSYKSHVSYRNFNPIHRKC